MTLNLFFIGAAIAVSATVLAWTFFRKPGVEFLTFAPVWRANQYLSPVGAALWMSGCILGSILVAAHFVGPYA